MELAAFMSACPNCRGEISSERLSARLPCEKCLPNVEALKVHFDDEKNFRIEIAKMLEKSGALREYASLTELDHMAGEFVDTFRKITRHDPWSAQLTWARRSARGESFAIIAPTGVGKTTFLTVLAVYSARAGKRVLMVAPTALLARQIASWVRQCSERLGVELRIAEIHGEETAKQKRMAVEMMTAGLAQIIIITSMGLGRSYEKLAKERFSVALVDDVDSLLRKSANIDRVLRLLGYDDNIQGVAIEAIKVRMRLARLFAQGFGDGEEAKKAIEEYRSFSLKVEDYKKNNPSLGQLIVSSATARPRGIKVRTFRELLGFEAGSSTSYMRNIVDVQAKPMRDMSDETIEHVKKLGKGGLIFVSREFGKPFMQKLERAFAEQGIKAYHTKAYFHKRVDEFAASKLDVLIGTASYYGKLVRGIDLPQTVRYAIFVGVPKFKTRLEDEEASPLGLIRLLYATADFTQDALERQQLYEHAIKLRKAIQNLSPGDLSLIMKAGQENKVLTGFLGGVQELVGEGRRIFHVMLSHPGVLEQLKNSDQLIIEEEKEGLMVLMPDVRTYIQASGRSSRLLGGKLAKGLSLVLVDNERVMSALRRSMQIASRSVHWAQLEEVDIEAVMREVDADRKPRKGKAKETDLMKSALLIVESPNKARTIANFFGRPGKIYSQGRVFYEVAINNTLFTITSTGGHIIDLPHDAPKRSNYGVPKLNGTFVPRYAFINRCWNCGSQFTGDGTDCPKCESNNLRRSWEVIDALRRRASDVSAVYIATDPDSEGEKIAWDVALLISPFSKSIKRARFHEITPEAVLGALQSSSEINLNLVTAQMTRRVDDRWIGYGLTELLTANRKQIFEDSTRKFRIPAGRVQLPLLGWIIKETELNRQQKVRRFRVRCKVGETIFTVSFKKPFYEIDAAQSRSIKEAIAGSTVRIDRILTTAVELKAPPPFTTDTVLTEASRNFGWSVGEVMRRLQDLFEAGLITYHRTDHTHVSSTGIEIARIYLESTFANEWQLLFQARQWGEEGAHECIRPTKPLNGDELKRQIDLLQLPGAEALDYRHIRLYDLVFRRFIASQMKPSKLMKQSAELSAGGMSAKLEGYCDVLEEGFNRVHPPRMVPPLREGQELAVSAVDYLVSSEHPLPSEGEAVAYMKQKGIGRPSTYAATIDRLKRHGYVFATKRNSLVATNRGKSVFEFLSQKLVELQSMLGEVYTADLQVKLQKIEGGELDHNTVMKECFADFKRIRTAGTSSA